MKIAGLTGGIGSGKTMVAKILAELGAYVIDADHLARKVVQPEMPAWEEIKKVFGEEVINPDQTLNRAKLAEIIFSDPEKKKKLEQITHPRIGEEILRKLDQAKRLEVKLVVIDAALLLESPLREWVKPVILVVADEKVRVERVCQRDKVRPEEVYARIRNQALDSERKEKADYVIDNNGGLKELRTQVAQIFQEILCL